MKHKVLKICVVASTLLISASLISVGSGGEEGCSATAYCFENGIQYDEVSCTGELSCVAYYEGVDCDLEVTECDDPPPPNLY